MPVSHEPRELQFRPPPQSRESGYPGNGMSKSSSRRLDIGNLVNEDTGKASVEAVVKRNAQAYAFSQPPATGIAFHIRDMPKRREWRQRPGFPAPRVDRPHVAEAIMVYERGACHGEAYACSRCRRGEGISYECVSLPDIPWCCSSCLYALSEEPCDARPLQQTKESDEEMGFWENINETADKSFVLALVAQIQRRAGHGLHENPLERAEQIERAAMTVSRLAGQWRKQEARRLES
ncbi:hypothetical protein GQ53DRAFT_286732 [Thozetella sp. PMI_491]|nr:hypothetical protein GQ53DRAFT_286732 [Thozetella sp. PMI_491]